MPAPESLPDLLRQEVGRLRARESRRVFDTMVYVGQLGADRDSFCVRAKDLPAFDAALRVDAVSGLLADTSEDCRVAWLARAGSPTLHDLDLEWFAAARLAFASRGRPLDGFYAFTRTGWLDVLTLEARTWKRLRL